MDNFCLGFLSILEIRIDDFLINHLSLIYSSTFLIKIDLNFNALIFLIFNFSYKSSLIKQC